MRTTWMASSTCALAVVMTMTAGARETTAQAPAAARPAPAAQAPAPPAAPKGIMLPSIPEEAAPTEAQLGITIYPNAQFIRSFDAGRGQRYYLFGAQASFTEIVNYYRTILKQRGELVFERPATHMFEVGRYREDTMAFPPGVTVKDFASTGSAGYPNPKPGGQPARFATIIQIVAVPPQQ